MKLLMPTLLAIVLSCSTQTRIAAQDIANPGDKRTANHDTVIIIGKVYSIDSDAVGEEREYRVLLPDSYASRDREYPVVYVLDGSAYFLSAYSAMKALSSIGAIPECIVVAVTSNNRMSDMSPPEMEISGVQNPRADKFLKFLADELVPHIDAQYRTRPLRVLIGHSHGGIFSLYALSSRPNAFRWHLALDTPMHLDDFYLERQTEQFLERQPGHKGRLVVGWSRFGWSSDRWQELKNATNSQGFRVAEIDLSGETHSSMFHTGMYLGLKQLFFDYDYQHDRILTIDQLDQRYQSMKQEYGYDTPIPLWALRYGALEHLAAADPEKAQPFIDRMVSDYETEMIFDNNAFQWLEQLKASPPEETRASYLAKPDARPAEISEFIGSWSGGGYTIEISSNGESLSGTIKQQMPGGETLSSEIKKFVVAENGSLELSQFNGMPPLSGILVYRLSARDDATLSAEKRFFVFWPRPMDTLKTFQLTRVRQ